MRLMMAGIQRFGMHAAEGTVAKLQAILGRPLRPHADVVREATARARSHATQQARRLARLLCDVRWLGSLRHRAAAHPSAARRRSIRLPHPPQRVHGSGR
ncbi:hypothetical protein ADT26_09870 [Xanthomonas oryzae]|nr:hypothetical protein AXO1947_00210 [Xanthomonas oryzae pv. oryzae]KOR44355.1 hypothetical protein ADT26_09870 [Xanthomonas oryzae]